MKTTTKLLGMTAAVAILSAPALAGTTVKTQVGEKVTYETKAYAEPGDNVVGYEIQEEQEFARLDTNNDGSVSRDEFYDNTMLPEEAETFALFDSNQSNEISPAEFSANSRYGNARITNNISNKTKSNSNANFGSLRNKYYTTQEYTARGIEPSAGDSTAVEAGIDYNGLDTEPNVNQGIDYKGEPRTPGSVNSNITYEGGTKTNYNYN